MTKEEYLKSLELALIEAKVDNYNEIVEKYRKRFELAALADMSTEEAINMMGSVDSVVKKYCNDDKTEYYEVYTFKIDDALASEITIKRGSKPGIVINVDESLIDKRFAYYLVSSPIVGADVLSIPSCSLLNINVMFTMSPALILPPSVKPIPLVAIDISTGFLILSM